MIVDLANALRRAKSLLSLHLCGNRGVTERIKEYMRTRIHAMLDSQKLSFKVSEVLERIMDLKSA